MEQCVKGGISSYPSPGHQKVSLSQLRTADQEIFKKVAEACHKGCGAAPGQTKTQFELAFEKEMESFAIRLMLQPLQGTSTASSLSFPGSGSSDAPVVQAPEMRKLQSKIKDLENQLRGTKRKLDNQSGASSSSQWGKGEEKASDNQNQECLSSCAANFHELPEVTQFATISTSQLVALRPPPDRNVRKDGIFVRSLAVDSRTRLFLRTV